MQDPRYMPPTEQEMRQMAAGGPPVLRDNEQSPERPHSDIDVLSEESES